MNKKLILALSLVGAVAVQPMPVSAFGGVIFEDGKMSQTLRDCYVDYIKNPDNPVYDVKIQRSEKDWTEIIAPIAFAVVFTALGWFLRGDYEQKKQEQENNKPQETEKKELPAKLEQPAEEKNIITAPKENEDEYADLLELVHLKVKFDPLCE